MIRKMLAVGITLLFIVSVISPLVFGNNVELKHQKQITTLEESMGVEWDAIYGDFGNDEILSVSQTDDGGYIGAGMSRSFSEDGYEAGILIKINAIGDMEWYQTYGENGPLAFDWVYSVVQTDDGGYIFSGQTCSYGDGDSDLWLVKTDSTGNEEWNRHFGGHDIDRGHVVKIVDDGGYAVSGMTYSFGAGGFDVWLVKFDNNGFEEWNQTYGTNESDKGWSFDTTTDGGYILAGGTSSYGAGKHNLWLIKTDAFGVEEWNQTFGNYNTAAYAVKQTNDGGYIATGYKIIENTGCVVPLVKFDSFGNELWNKSFGEPLPDNLGESVDQTPDGGYVIAGYRTIVEGGYRRFNSFLYKTDPDGNLEWELIFDGHGENINSAQVTDDGGCIIGGERYSDRPFDGLDDLWITKVGHIPDMSISKPEDALYFLNLKLRNFQYRNPLIIGPIDVEVDASDDEYDIDRVEFYVDGDLLGTDTTVPYSWRWNKLSFFTHNLKAVAYNSNGNVGVEEKTLWKFL